MLSCSFRISGRFRRFAPFYGSIWTKSGQGPLAGRRRVVTQIAGRQLPHGIEATNGRVVAVSRREPLTPHFDPPLVLMRITPLEPRLPYTASRPIQLSPLPCLLAISSRNNNLEEMMGIPVSDWYCPFGYPWPEQPHPPPQQREGLGAVGISEC